MRWQLMEWLTALFRSWNSLFWWQSCLSTFWLIFVVNVWVVSQLSFCKLCHNLAWEFSTLVSTSVRPSVVGCCGGPIGSNHKLDGRMLLVNVLSELSTISVRSFISTVSPSKSPFSDIPVPALVFTMPRRNQSVVGIGSKNVVLTTSHFWHQFYVTFMGVRNWV